MGAERDSKPMTPGLTEQHGSRRSSRGSRSSKSSRSSRSSRASKGSRASRYSRGSDASSSSDWLFSTKDSEWDAPVETVPMELLSQDRRLSLQQLAAYLPAGSSEADFQLKRVRHELQVKRQQVVQVGLLNAESETC